MDFKDIVGKYLPKVLGAAVNPIGAGIDVLTSVLGDIFGFDPKITTPEQADQIISQDPERVLKLKLAEMDYNLRMREQDISELKTILADVQSARAREVQIAQAGRSNFPMYALAAIVCLGFFALLAILMRYPLPDGSKEAAFILVGTLGAGFSNILSYFFGSSKGSADKSDQINQMKQQIR